MKKQKKSANFIISIVLFVIAGLAGITSVRVLTDVIGTVSNYLSEASAYGYGLGFGEYGDIIFYVIDSSIQPLSIMCILFALGWILIQKDREIRNNNATVKVSVPPEPSPSEIMEIEESQPEDESTENDDNKENEDFEKWYENNEK